MIRFFHWQCSASDEDWPLVGACHSVAHGSWLLQATQQPTTGEQVGNERAARSSHDGQLQQRFCLLSCLNRCTMRTCSLLGQTAACLTAEVCHLAALPASSHLPRQRVQCSLAAARRALFVPISWDLARHSGMRERVARQPYVLATEGVGCKCTAWRDAAAQLLVYTGLAQLRRRG